MLFEEINSFSALDKIIQSIKESVNCSLPCQVKKVNGNYVDVLVFRNDEIEDGICLNVPIKREETNRAYIFLGIKEGDYGTIKFYDKSIEDYKRGITDYNGDNRNHNENDGAFELGFIPAPLAFVYPADQEIEIGLKNACFKMSVDNSGNLVITSIDDIVLKSNTSITLDSPVINTTGALSAGNGQSAMVATQSGIITFTNGIFTGSS